MASGIYIIHNTKTGQVYIGQAQTIAKRWKSHVKALDSKTHANRHLQTAWNEYGIGAFAFKVLEHCDPDQLDIREKHYLAIYMAKGFCYNIRKASRSTEPRKRTRTGRKFSPRVTQFWVRSDDDFMERLNAAVEQSGMAKADFLFKVITEQLKKMDTKS